MESQPELVRVLLIDDDRDDYFLTRELVSDIPGGRFHLDWTPEYDAGVQAVRAVRGRSCGRRPRGPESPGVARRRWASAASAS